MALKTAPLRSVHMRDGDREVQVLGRSDTSTGLVLKELFDRRVYAPVPGRTAPRAILDIGAYVGLTAGYFRLVYPDATLCCVEPDPASYAVLARNAETLGRCHAFNLGLFDRDGTATFHASEIPVLSSLFPSAGGRSKRDQVQVRLRHAGAFFDEMLSRCGLPGFDLIKMDTEGSELPILRALGERIAGIGVIQLEFHSHDDRRAIDDLLCQTHRLAHGRIDEPHRGTLTYSRIGPAA